MAAKTNAVLNSTKYDANGRNMVEEPKPAMVPTISENNAIIRSIINASSKFTFQGFKGRLIVLNYLMVVRAKLDTKLVNCYQGS